MLKTNYLPAAYPPNCESWVRRLTTSVWLRIARKPIIVNRDSEGWGNSPTTSLLHSDHLALTNDLCMAAIPVCRRKLKPYFQKRRWLKDTLSSKQDSSVTDVFRPCLKPFWTVWYAITNRNLDRETFRTSRDFVDSFCHSVIPRYFRTAWKVFYLRVAKHSQLILQLKT